MEINLQKLKKLQHKHQIFIKFFVDNFFLTIPFLIVIITILFFIPSFKQKKYFFDNPFKIGQEIQNTKQQLISNYQISISNPDLNILFLHGPISQSGNTINSQNNLLLYKSRTLPIYSFVNTTLPLKNLQNSDAQNIETFLYNFVLLTNKQSAKNFSFKRLYSPQNLFEKFQIFCTQRPFFYKLSCNKYTKNFLENFEFFYLQNHIGELENIFDHLSTKNKNIFCEKLKNNLIYYNDFSDNMQNLIKKCGVDFYEFFSISKNFMEIKNELDKNQISSKLYAKLLNQFKLVSIQQKIFENLQKGILPETLIYGYLKFTQKLLTLPSKIEKFYFDEIYVFNHYLINKLKTNSYIWGNDRILKIIGNIEELENEKKIYNLKKQLNFQFSFTDDKNKNTQTSNTNINQDFDFLLQKINFLEINKITKNGNSATLQGYFLIFNFGGYTYKLYTKLMISIENGKIFVQKAYISDKKINTIMNILLQKNGKMPILDFYLYILALKQ